MPEALWASAVSLAQRHGVGPMARALGIDYGTLKKRTYGPRKTTKAATARAEFIELAPTALLGRPEPAGVTIELSDGNGSKLVVRVPCGEVVDVESVIRAFWSRG
jgi:hypothetical protein